MINKSQLCYDRSAVRRKYITTAMAVTERIEMITVFHCCFISLISSNVSKEVISSPAAKKVSNRKNAIIMFIHYLLVYAIFLLLDALVYEYEW